MNIKPLEFYENYYGCWIVISHKSKPRGYPAWDRNGKRLSIHRYMYQKYKGKILKGIYVCHTCDNKGCINPTHLFLGTQKDNIQDALTKGRVAHGENNGSSILTERQVLEIRDAKGTLKEIGKEYKTSYTNVRSIKRKQTWSWLT